MVGVALAEMVSQAEGHVRLLQIGEVGGGGEVYACVCVCVCVEGHVRHLERGEKGGGGGREKVR